LTELIWLGNKPSSLEKISHHNGKDKVKKNLISSNSDYQKRAKTTMKIARNFHALNALAQKYLAAAMFSCCS